MGTLTNSADPDEMPHKVVFHQDMHCLLTQNRSSEKKRYILEIITYYRSIYTIDHLELTVSIFMDNSFVLKGLNDGVAHL